MTVRLYNFRTASGESRELFYTVSAGTSRIIDKADVSDEPRAVNCGGRLLLRGDDVYRCGLHLSRSRQ